MRFVRGIINTPIAIEVTRNCDPEIAKSRWRGSQSDASSSQRRLLRSSDGFATPAGSLMVGHAMAVDAGALAREDLLGPGRVG
jgi:hypothetical protein